MSRVSLNGVLRRSNAGIAESLAKPVAAKSTKTVKTQTSGTAAQAGAPYLLREDRGRVAVLTLNRPQSRNSIGRPRHEPRDGSDTFLTVPAEILLRPTDDDAAQKAREGLKDKIVLIGGMFPDIDRHLTPLSARTDEMQTGAVIHAHIVAELVDGRGIGQLETNSLALKFELAVVAALAFLIGWRKRLKRQGVLLGSFATVAIIAVDTFVFWQWRIILPIVLALLAWFLGEFTGHYIGKWLGQRRSDRSRWFVR